MTEFAIHVGNRPGELARIATVLSRYGVNIRSVAAQANGSEATLRILPDNPEPARAALEKDKITFEETEVVTVLLENRAGELAEMADKLANAGVNLLAIYLTGRVEDLVELAVIADDAKKAKKLLE